MHQYSLKFAFFASAVWVIALLVMSYLIAAISDYISFGNGSLLKILAFALIAVTPLVFIEYDVSAMIKPGTVTPLVGADDARRYMRFGLWICMLLVLLLGAVVHLVATGKAKEIFGGPDNNSMEVVFVSLLVISLLARTITWYLAPLSRRPEMASARMVIQGSPPEVSVPDENGDN